MPRHLAPLALLAALASPSVAAEPYDLDVQRFRPAMDSRGLVTVERTKALGTFEPSIGLFLNYAFGVLDQEIDGKTADIVESYGSGNLILSLGFFNVAEIGVDLPMVIIRGDKDGAGEESTLAADGFGDTKLSLKIRLLDQERAGVGLALVPAVYLPSGESDVFASQGEVVLAPKVAADFALGSRVSAAVNVGALLREKRTLSGSVTIADGDVTRTVARGDEVVTGGEVTYGVGVAVALLKDRLELITEGYGAVSLESGAKRATPLEALAALRLFLLGNSFLTAGASRGLLDAYGDPDLRVFAGIVFEPAVGDRDGDGVDDDIDRCPDEPEDKDGFEDQDGCPDPDNDEDGILDIVDQCPDLPEDKNGFEDDDGCPEGNRDRDGDGILDQQDRCPDDPEDKDGFEDEDGCPDPDNDQDGILDVEDKCPNDPEDIDGFDDLDGCPDLDNDQDGIPDVKDECPNEPENKNGVEDEDGCPEVPRKVVITGGKIEILDKVFFETNSAVIKTESYDILFQVGETLRQNPRITLVEIQGHTDSRGDDDYNLDLSNRRAASVRTFLIEKAGIAADRLVSRGYGETQPIDPAENIQAWAKNRRVEFIIKSESEPAHAPSPLVP